MFESRKERFKFRKRKERQEKTDVIRKKDKDRKK